MHHLVLRLADRLELHLFNLTWEKVDFQRGLIYDLKHAFGTACQLAGIENPHWHDLRHTFGTRLAEAGCSEATIADLMGHSDPQTT